MDSLIRDALDSLKIWLYQAKDVEYHSIDTFRIGHRTVKIHLNEVTVIDCDKVTNIPFQSSIDNTNFSEIEQELHRRAKKRQENDYRNSLKDLTKLRYVND